MSRSNKLPTVLEKEEQQRLINIFNTRYPTAQRNKTIAILFLNAGLRLSELLNLKWKDINLISGKLKVVEGKGAKDRILYLDDNTIEKLKDWKDRQAKEIDKRIDEANISRVFTTLKNNKMDTSNTRKMIKKYAKKADINKKISPHTLRHTFATDLYRDSKNIRLVQKALGHSNLSTTMIYTHIVDDELEQALKTFRK